MPASMTVTAASSVLPAGEIAGLRPLASVRSRWPALIGGALTLAMILGVAHQMFGWGMAGLRHALPRSPGFYLAFLGYYFSGPAFDFVIFRRLWAVPWAGFAALVKKQIANNSVLGYSGEAYFYAWARARAPMVAAPFGAVKDVSILSAIAGNGVTLILVAFSMPYAAKVLSPDQFRAAIGSAALAIATSVPFLIFSRRVFSLRARQLWEIFGLHVARLAISSAFLALAWHFAMHEVSIKMWLFLVGARLLVSRLPFVPNKDLLFATIAILLIGEHRVLSDLLTVTAAIGLVSNIVLIAAFGILHLVNRKLI